MKTLSEELWKELNINLVINYGWQWETEEFCSEDCFSSPNDALADFCAFLAEAQNDGKVFVEYKF